MRRHLYPGGADRALFLRQRRHPGGKETTQLFFDLPKFEPLLREWTRSGALQEQVANKLQEWIEDLQPWDISREAPYFGFEIPGYPGKYFYVWLDAPIGYMASFQNYCDREGLSFDDYWGKESTAELYHFIGKDIINFHGLFWPAMLDGAGLRKPTAIYSHGFVTVNGAKMSKSRGTFIKARTYLDHLSPEYLRYYFAAKLSSRVDDFDLNLEDFAQRVNSDLVGKLVNIASRTGNFVKKFGGTLSTDLDNMMLVREVQEAARALPISTRSANSAKPCVKSWRWPITPTATSPTRRPGAWPRKKARSRKCWPSAAPPSTCSACW